VLLNISYAAFIWLCNCNVTEVKELFLRARIVHFTNSFLITDVLLSNPTAIFNTHPPCFTLYYKMWINFFNFAKDEIARAYKFKTLARDGSYAI